MILVNVNEHVVELLKSDIGLFVVSPTYKINMNGTIEQNPAPTYVPVVGVLAVVGNFVLLDNTNRYISHMKLKFSNSVDFEPENNFMICEIVSMTDHLLVYSITNRYTDNWIMGTYYDFAGRKTDTKEHPCLSLPTSRGIIESVCYYGINEYNNIQRWAGSHVTSLQAFPPKYGDVLIGDSKINQERAINAMQHPFNNDYLIHHTGFMQDTLPEEDQKNGINEMEAVPNQYYSTENRGFFDETWNWYADEEIIKQRKVSGMLQEAPMEVQPPLDMQAVGEGFRIPDHLTRPIQNESGDDLVPTAVYKHGDGIVVEFRNERTGETVPVFCREDK